MPSRREEVRQSGPAHECGQQPAAAADRLHCGPEHDHGVSRYQSGQGTEGELHLPGTPLILHRPGRKADLVQAVAQRADRALDAIEPGFGEELVALLEDLDRRRRCRHPRLVQADAIADQADDVVLDLEPRGVRVPGLLESLKLLAHDGAPIERHRPAVAEVDITEHPAGAIRPGQDSKGRWVRHDHHVGEAGEFLDTKAAARAERGWKHRVAGVEAVDGAGEVRSVAHRRDRGLGREELGAWHAVLVDKHDPHRAQLLVANLGRHPACRLELLLGVQSVLGDEPRYADAVVGLRAVVLLLHTAPLCSAWPSSADRIESISWVAKAFGCMSARVSSVSVRCTPGICQTRSRRSSRR